MRVLLVAPQVGLEYAEAELVEVVNAFSAKLLRRATIHSLLDAVESRTDGKAWDVLWFATHGTKDGIELTDGKLSLNELTAVVRQSGAGLIVLNTCSSLEVALAIHSEVEIDLVCTVKDVADRSAYVTGRVFARRLQMGLTPYQAWTSARLGRNDDFVYIPGKQRMEGSKQQGPQPNGRVDQLYDKVDELLGLMHGNDHWQYVGVLSTVQMLKEEVAAIRQKLEQMESRQQFDRRMQIALTVMVFLLLALVIGLFGSVLVQ